MRSASCYTDLRRTVAYAKNRKVQYPGSVAKNWEALQAALPCNPNFDIQNYVGNPIYCGQTNACATIVFPPSYPLMYFIQPPESYPGDPGSGNFTSSATSPPTYIFKFSNTTSNGDNVSTQLGNIAIGSIITATKTSDPGVSFQASLQSKTNNTTYWTFTVTLLSLPPGSISSGDNLTFTYI